MVLESIHLDSSIALSRCCRLGRDTEAVEMEGSSLKAKERRGVLIGWTFMIAKGHLEMFRLALSVPAGVSRFGMVSLPRLYRHKKCRKLANTK